MRTILFLLVGTMGLTGLARGQASAADLARSLKHKDRAERLRAANELGKLGAGAAGAASALGAALGDEVPEVRNAAADALGKIGKPAVAVVDKALGDQARQAAAMRAAGNLGPLAVGLLPAVTKPWRSVASDTAIQQCLLAIGEPALPHLIECLKDNAINLQVCQVLSSMGPKAKAAVPALIELLGRTGPRAPEGAAAALGPIGDERAVAALLAAAEPGLTKISATPATITSNAVRSLGEIRAQPDLVVPFLLRVLASERRDFEFVRIQGQALGALEHFDVRKPAVLDALRAFLAAQPGENKGPAERLLEKLSG